MVDYLPNEIVDMIRILGEAGSNYSAAERLYAERYPNRCHPCRKKDHKKIHREITPGQFKKNMAKIGAKYSKFIDCLGSKCIESTFLLNKSRNNTAY